MPFTNDPGRDVDRVRIKVGDTDPTNEFLSDDWYMYFLGEYSGSETRAALEVGKAILARFSTNTREVVDQVEIYGNQLFEQYLEWLKEFTNSSALSGLAPPKPYAGGISKSDMRQNNENSDNNTRRIYAGYIEDTDTLKGYEQLESWFRFQE